MNPTASLPCPFSLVPTLFSLLWPISSLPFHSMNIDLDWCIVCDSRTERGLYCSNKCSTQDKQTNEHTAAVDVSADMDRPEGRPIPTTKDDCLSAFYANHAPSPTPIAKSPSPSEILSSSYTIYSRSRRSSVMAIPSPTSLGQSAYFARD